MSKQRHTILVSGLLALLLALALMAGCRENSNPAAEAEVDKSLSENLPTEQFFDYRLVETNVGIRKWVLVSDQMNKYSGQKDVELITVHIDFYRDGAHFSTLTSDSGTANLQTKDIFTWGNVVVITQDGRMLETEELYFNNTEQLIHNDVFDRFTRQEDVIEGIGLEATPDLEYIEIKRQVEADVVDSEPMESDSR